MTTLAELNALRVANGMAELKSWKNGQAKLLEAIAKLTPAEETKNWVTDETDPSMPMGENGNSLVDALPKPMITAKEFFSQVPGHEDYQPVSKQASPLPGWEANGEAQVPSPVHPDGGPSNPTSDESAQKAPRGAIGNLVMELLQTEMPYEDIVKQVRETYPSAKTTARSIASVAMDLRAAGLTIPSRRKVAKAKAEAVSEENG